MIDETDNAEPSADGPTTLQISDAFKEAERQLETERVSVEDGSKPRRVELIARVKDILVERAIVASGKATEEEAAEYISDRQMRRSNDSYMRQTRRIRAKQGEGKQYKQQRTSITRKIYAEEAYLRNRSIRSIERSQRTRLTLTNTFGADFHDPIRNQNALRWLDKKTQFVDWASLLRNPLWRQEAFRIWDEVREGTLVKKEGPSATLKRLKAARTRNGEQIASELEKIAARLAVIQAELAGLGKDDASRWTEIASDRAKGAASYARGGL